MDGHRARLARRASHMAMTVATLAACWLAAGAPLYHHY